MSFRRKDGLPYPFHCLQALAYSHFLRQETSGKGGTSNVAEKIRRQAREYRARLDVLPLLIVAAERDDFEHHVFARGLDRMRCRFVLCPLDLEGYEPGRCLVETTERGWRSPTYSHPRLSELVRSIP